MVVNKATTCSRTALVLAREMAQRMLQQPTKRCWRVRTLGGGNYYSSMTMMVQDEAPKPPGTTKRPKNSVIATNLSTTMNPWRGTTTAPASTTFWRAYSTTSVHHHPNSAKSKTRSPLHHAAPSFRATKVYFTGELEHATVKSTDLLRHNQVHIRDLFEFNLTSRQERQLNKLAGGKSPVRHALAAILPRKNVIVLSFAQIRAVVGREYVLFLEAQDPFIQEFAQELAATYRSIHNQQRYNHLTSVQTVADCHSNNGSGGSNGYKNEAMELIFLEEVLRYSVESLHRRLRLYEPIVHRFLDTVANEVYSDTGVHQLAPLQDSLQLFEMHVKQCLECLTRILDDDEEMLALLLTEQAKAAETGQAVDFQRHQHVELLIGVYARQLKNLLMEIQYLLQRIQSKQEFVALALAGYRNRMIRINVTISVATLSLCMGTTVAGFFGMNVVNGLEDSTTAFSHIVMYSTLAGLGVGVGSLSYLSGRALQDRASQRLQEIETLSGALSDMGAVDHAVKSTLLEGGTTISKEEFRKKLIEARQSGEVSDDEVDLLFDVLDNVKDGFLSKDDMETIGLGKNSSSSSSTSSSKMPSTYSGF